MKKIVAIVLLLVFRLSIMAQVGPYPVTQNIASPTTLLNVGTGIGNTNGGGGLRVFGGIIPAIYPDTAHANLISISTYQGAQIATGNGDSLWIRDNNKWELYYPSGGGSTPTLSQVLTAGNSGGNLQINNLNNLLLTDGFTQLKSGVLELKSQTTSAGISLVTDSLKFGQFYQIEVPSLPAIGSVNLPIYVNGIPAGIGGNIPLDSSNTSFATQTGLNDTAAAIRAVTQTSVSLTTTGSSGAATFNPVTGALNIPNYVTPQGNLTGDVTSVGLATTYNNIVPVSKGGTGTATPSIVAGTNVTVTGSWPNQTINASGGGSTTLQQAITASNLLTKQDTVLMSANDTLKLKGAPVSIDSARAGQLIVGGKLAPIIGSVFNDYFNNRTSIGGNYTVSATNATYGTPTSGLPVSGSTTNYTNNLIRNYYTSSETYIDTIIYKTTTSSSTSSLIVGNLGSQFSFYVNFDLSTGAGSGKVSFQTVLGTNFSTSSTGVTYTAGDSIIGVVNINRGLATATIIDVTSATTATNMYLLPTSVTGGNFPPNTSRPVIYFYGGGSGTLNKWSLNQTAFRNVYVDFAGMSITKGYAASDIYHRHQNLFFNNDSTKFSTDAGSGNTIADLQNSIIEISSNSPAAYFLEIGTNDIPSLSPSQFTLQYENLTIGLAATGAKVYCAAILPRVNAGVPIDFVTYNNLIKAVCKRHGYVYFDNTAPFIVNGNHPNPLYYYSDSVHLINAGHAKYDSTMLIGVPELLTIYNNSSTQNNSSATSFYNNPTTVSAPTSFNNTTTVSQVPAIDDNSNLVVNTSWVNGYVNNKLLGYINLQPVLPSAQTGSSAISGTFKSGKITTDTLSNNTVATLKVVSMTGATQFGGTVSQNISTSNTFQFGNGLNFTNSGTDARVTNSSGTRIIIQPGSTDIGVLFKIFAANFERTLVSFQSPANDSILEIRLDTVMAEFQKPVRIKDGSQGTGKVFVSDANGTGSWSSAPTFSKLNITTGSNATVGTSTLSGGTVTVSTTAVTASSKIFLTDATTGALTNIGTPTVGTVTAGVSFVINSSNVLDTSNINWLIIN